MLAPKRQQMILEILRDQGEVSVEELAQRFDVVPITIRRDLSKMEQEKLLVRSHGGAVLNAPLETEVLYDTKEQRNQAEKQRIAAGALHLVEEGMTLILDAGTTTFQLMRALKQSFSHLNIITTDLKIALEAMDTNFTVYFAGGLLQNETGSSIDITAVQYIADIRADIAFLATSGISPDYYITTPNTYKKETKLAMLRAAGRQVMLADSSKFYKSAFMKIAPLSALSDIISDRAFTPTEQATYENMGVQLHKV